MGSPEWAGGRRALPQAAQTTDNVSAYGPLLSYMGTEASLFLQAGPTQSGGFTCPVASASA